MQEEKEVRRSFLKHILAGSAVAAATLVGKKTVNAKEQPVKPEGNEILYSESEAFKKYYRSLRS